MNRSEYIKDNQAIQRRYERAYYPSVKKAIQFKIDQTIHVVENYGIKTAINHLNNQVENIPLTKIIQDLALTVGLRFARRNYVNLNNQKVKGKGTGFYFVANAPTVENKGFGFNEAWTNWIKNYLFDFIVTKISFKVFETTKDVLFTTLNQAIREGWGVDETVKALEALPLAKSQAARIVRTEITRAANAGTMAASSTFPYAQTKEWISTHDTRVRGFDPRDHASHLGMDGQTVNYENHFTDPRNGNELMFPGDPQAPPADTVNCRCAMAVLAKLDSNGRLIPKPKTTSVIYPTNRRRQIVTV